MNEKYYISYFTHQELSCRQTGKIVLAEGFADKLVELRTKFGQSMQISSACRSRDYNRKIGGAINSFHIYDYPRYGFSGCCAVDVVPANNNAKGDLIALAWQLGWAIGVGENFIHFDRRVDYCDLKQLVFTY